MDKINVLVTGANGFVGRNLLDIICSNSKINVIATDVHEEWIPFSKETKKPLNYISGDVSNRGFVSSIINNYKFDAVVHLAAIISQSSNMDTYYSIINSNVRATFLLCEAAFNQKARFIFPSTGLIYGNQTGPFKEDMLPDPKDFYSLSKLMCEQIIKFFSTNYQLKATIFRIGILYGPSQSNSMFIPSLVKALVDKKEFAMTKGEQKRDFIYIRDFVSLIERVIVDENVCGLFNIGSKKSVKLIEVAEIAEKLTQSFGLIKPGAIQYRPNESMEYFLDTTKAEKLLNWHATTNILEGLKKTIEYYKNSKKESL